MGFFLNYYQTTGKHWGGGNGGGGLVYSMCVSLFLFIIRLQVNTRGGGNVGGGLGL